MESKPHKTQTIKETPTLPTSMITPFGEMKIPTSRIINSIKNL